MAIERRYIVLVVLAITANLVILILAVNGFQDYQDTSPFTTFSNSDYLIRIVSIIGFSWAILDEKRSNRNLMIGLLLGVVTAQGIYDSSYVFGNLLGYDAGQLLANVGMLAAVAVPGAVIALTEIMRSKQELGPTPDANSR